MIVLIVDLGLMLGSLALTLYLKYGQVTSNLWQDHIRYFLPVYIFTLFLFYLYNLYNYQAFRRKYLIAVNILSALAISFVFAVIYLYFQPVLTLTPRRFLLTNYAVIAAVLIIWRWILRYVFSLTASGTNLLFLGDRGLYESLSSELKTHPHLGFKEIIYCNPEEPGLKHIANQKRASHIVVAPNAELNSFSASELMNVLPLGLSIQPYLEFFEQNFTRIPARSLSYSWFVNTFKYQRKPVYDFLKRLIDILFGLVGMVFNAILFPFIALAIKLESQGPIFFRGVRVGKNGKQFKIVKYRTMTVWDGDDWAKDNDSRITKVGKFLRKSRLDEFPQFWNVLIGNMSLVGPRPEQPHIVENLSKDIPFYEQRHLIKCGLTGWAQISSGYAGTVDESRTKFEYDLYYVKNRSLAFDFEIIAHTVRIVLGLKGR